MAVRRELLDPTDPASVPPTDRVTEVAAILAAGVIRLRAERTSALPRFRSRRNSAGHGGAGTSKPPPGTSKFPPESRETRLEVSRSSRPDGPCG